MNEIYKKPIAKINEFKTEDIVTTSGFDDTQKGDNDVNFGD